MSLIDKLVAAVTSPETAEQRAQARAKARSVAQGNDWLSRIIDHHEQIESAFAAVKADSEAGSRSEKLQHLGLLLTGHAQAEEAVIYPALAQHGEKGHATTGYDDQAAVKMEMAALAGLSPASQEFRDKLEHIETAVAHHVFAEENHWFVELKDKLSASDQAKLTERYIEEYDRYVGRYSNAEPAHADFTVSQS